MCGSSRPVRAISMPSSLRRPRVLDRPTQPAASKASRRSSHGLWTALTAGALPFRPCRPWSLLDQVAGGVAQLGAVVVVGAEDVRAGELHQRAERVQHLGDAFGVGEVVAGVDHEVGAQPGERLEPALLLALSADHVDVGDLQDAQRPHAAGQYGHGDAPQAEGTDFEAGGVGQAGRADCGQGQGYSVSRAHAPIVAEERGKTGAEGGRRGDRGRGRRTGTGWRGGKRRAGCLWGRAHSTS